jgi:hypothetical protein
MDHFLVIKRLSKPQELSGASAQARRRSQLVPRQLNSMEVPRFSANQRLPVMMTTMRMTMQWHKKNKKKRVRMLDHQMEMAPAPQDTDAATKQRSVMVDGCKRASELLVADKETGTQVMACHSNSTIFCQGAAIVIRNCPEVECIGPGACAGLTDSVMRGGNALAKTLALKGPFHKEDNCDLSIMAVTLVVICHICA